MPRKDPQIRQTLMAYVELVQRLANYRKFIYATAAVGVVITILVTVLYPATYRSSTLILVQSQRVPSSYVRSSISVDLHDRIRTLTPQIMSRTRLESIIKKFHLFGETDGADMEARVNTMRGAIDVKVKGHDTFRIYFEHRSPETAKIVTEELARLFIAENLRDREEQAVSTSEFITTELNELKEALDKQDATLRAFKEGNVGVLPNQQSANLRSLDRFQLRYQSNAQALESARKRRMDVETQMASLTDEEDGAVMVISDPHLELLRRRLAELQTRYTTRHPDVRSLVRRIETMEEKLASLRDSGGDTTGNSDPYVQSVLAKVQKVEREIIDLEKEQVDLERKIRSYQNRIELLPSVEEKLTILTRDYEMTRQNYQALLKKKFEADLSVDLERKQQGAAFKILDPAFLPETPFRPKRSLFLLVGLFLSLAIPSGIAFLLDNLDTTIRKKGDLDGVADLRVLSVIPRLEPAVTEELPSEDVKVLSKGM